MTAYLIFSLRLPLHDGEKERKKKRKTKSHRAQFEAESSQLATTTNAVKRVSSFVDGRDNEEC